ncbi:hypothetical protein SAMN05421776_11398 [Nocardia farcinica]|uniref:Uncharacterized protein n=1 Tax=Nocardia farcinica TaxID=37329 RepID=A0A0H5PAU8_NOCFR|nr:DUF6225 family protein [Nocardia farcinica]AXK89993.1 hypothetical protein DXT66_29840 [Nocardia farcinica]PFW99445.1 hypothetical protein CJ469_05365 [Nocardia farcinica]PFX06856.1 hypothetical protein CJ468_04256 [Nocardia farcinica]CRY84528.1 Uncharacterised protein [Nocardia farcinica]SIT32777.1 hypothetical protein SAMN05421776_11398 [Nocardia farcinica]
MTAESAPKTPPAQRVLTVGQIREALAQFPDDLPLMVCVPVDDDTYESYGVTMGPYHQRADWGDGLGPVADERYVAIDAMAYFLALREELEITSADSVASEQEAGL